jgi:hypothetical protein
MSVAEILRKKAMQVVPLALFVNLIANFVRLLFHEVFYDHNSYAALVCGPIGFLFSILTLVYSLKCLKGGWRVTAVIVSLLTGYWWLSDVVWWFMPY